MELINPIKVVYNAVLIPNAISAKARCNVATSDKVLKQLAKALDYDVDKLLAKADSVNEDIKKIIKKLPTAVPDFLRTAKNLTEDEWKDLTEQIKNRKKK